MTKWRFQLRTWAKILQRNSIYKYIYLYILFLWPEHPFSKTSFRHFVITSLQVWHHLYKTTIKIVVTYSTHVVYRDKKARISLRASCALSIIVNNLKQNYSSLLTQKTMEKRRESKKMRNFVGAFDCIDKLNLPCGSHLHNKNNNLPAYSAAREQSQQQGKRKEWRSVTIWQPAISGGW